MSFFYNQANISVILIADSSFIAEVQQGKNNVNERQQACLIHRSFTTFNLSSGIEFPLHEILSEYPALP